MIPASFEYVRPGSLDEAIRILNETNQPTGGATDEPTDGATPSAEETPSQ